MVVKPGGPEIFSGRTRGLHRFDGGVPCSRNARGEWALHRITGFGRGPEGIEVPADSIRRCRKLDKPRAVRSLRRGEGRITKLSHLCRPRKVAHPTDSRQGLPQSLLAPKTKRLFF